MTSERPRPTRARRGRPLPRTGFPQVTLGLRPGFPRTALGLRRVALGLPLAALGAALAACSSGGGNEAFQIRTTAFVGVDDGSARVRGDLAVFRASEALQGGGTNLNGDTDTTDGVAVALRFSDRLQRNLGAAPREIEILGDQVYLVVDEVGNNEWGGTAAAELVLLRWNFGLSAPVFVDVVDPDSPLGLVAAGSRLWYATDEDPIAVNGTNLRYIDSDDPATPQTVDTDGATLGTVRVQLVGAVEGLLRLALDEQAAGGQGDLNGDLDDTDSAVLALVEVAADPPVVVGTGLAQPAADAPFDVRAVDAGVFDVLCLVSEAAQGATNLNPSAVALPASCTNGLDLDADDDVLHLIEWQGGGIAATINTEFAGALQVLLMEDFLVTLVRESDLGQGGGCDATGDGPTDDVIVRWAPRSTPTVPVDIDSLYEPVDTTVPGDTRGLAVVEPLLIAALDLSFDVGAGPLALPWLGRVAPGSSNVWSTSHLDVDGPTGIKLGVRRMDSPQLGRVRLELLETALNQNLNVGCTAQVKDFLVADQADAVPAWLRYSPTFDATVVSGVGFGLEPADGGVVLAFGRAFFRVSESADGRDWNLDGDATDWVLFRTPLASCIPILTSILDAGPGDSIVTDGVNGALFYSSETGAGKDLNGDGVVGGSAVRYFRDF